MVFLYLQLVQEAKVTTPKAFQRAFEYFINSPSDEHRGDLI